MGMLAPRDFLICCASNTGGPVCVDTAANMLVYASRVHYSKPFSVASLRFIIFRCRKVLGLNGTLIWPQIFLQQALTNSLLFVNANIPNFSY